MKISESTNNGSGGDYATKFWVNLFYVTGETAERLVMHLANVDKRRGVRFAVLCRLALFEF